MILYTGTKTVDPFDLKSTTPKLWVRNNETGYVTFNASARTWSVTARPSPATGFAIPEHPPDRSLCLEDPKRCVTNAIELGAESPVPCPIGHYCKSGVATDVPVPKNFSTPQVCMCLCLP